MSAPTQQLTRRPETPDTAGVLACPGCDGTRISEKWLVNGFRIVHCDSCELVFVANRPTVDELKTYYGQIHDSIYDDSNSECLAFYYRALKREIERRGKQQGRIFDVGCAGGWFLDGMEGWERHGCEMAPQDFAIARSKHGDRILPLSFEEYPEKAEYFDVITLQDVFDHMPEPGQALAKCFRMLRPGGLLVIKVHDISCLYARVTGSQFYAVIPPGHLFYYREKSLRRILERAHFQVISARHMGHILKLTTIFLRLSRGREQSLCYSAAKMLQKSPLGNLKIYKNLHDIITVFAVRT
jgi:2-polyprenyl-3-methyl-5-hydroxy-6-metoxy-1,4-benzoquinol methylase